MSIYGNIFSLKSESIEEKAMSLYEFADYIRESDYQVQLMFEKADIITILKEENTSLSVPVKIDFDSEPEEVKKTLIQKMKEVINNFINTVKRVFREISEKIYKIYMETNFVDKFVSKYKNDVTYQNIEKAIKMDGVDYLLNLN